jgi:hypothetical protein
MIANNRVLFVTMFALAAAAACSDADVAAPPTTTLRPGIKDSSKSFQGTASPSETAFWEAVRKGDDTARAKAVEDLKKDSATDPKNAYSAFLAAANVSCSR